MVGRLERVNLREVWANEAANFTTWLERHLDILSEHIDIDLSALEREKSVGSFSVDIYAEGPNGDMVVIENQLEKTDHDHLGKLVTYLSNLEAKTAIWITSNPRPEHATAINWLNKIAPLDVSFFLVKVEAYKIGDSEPAPLFTTICGPSLGVKIVKQELTGRYLKRWDFWTKLLEKSKSKTDLHSNISPSKDNWIMAGAGKSGMGWLYSIVMDEAFVELFIDRGADRKEETDEIYEKLLNDQEEIEKRFGEALIWDKVEGRRVCRIKSICTDGGLKNEDSWDQIQEDLIDRMKRLENALREPLSKI